MEGEAIFSAQSCPPLPKGRQIWETGTAPAQMAASSWLWHGDVLTLGCWPLRFPQPRRAGPLEGRDAGAGPCQQLRAGLTWHPGPQPPPPSPCSTPRLLTPTGLPRGGGSRDRGPAGQPPQTGDRASDGQAGPRLPPSHSRRCRASPQPLPVPGSFTRGKSPPSLPFPPPWAAPPRTHPRALLGCWAGPVLHQEERWRENSDLRRQ